MHRNGIQSTANVCTPSGLAARGVAFGLLALLWIGTSPLLAQSREAADDPGAESMAIPEGGREYLEWKRENPETTARLGGTCNTCNDAADFGPFTPGAAFSTHSSTTGNPPGTAADDGDCNWYEFNVTRGTMYEFTTCTPGTSDYDTYLELHDSTTCSLIAENDDADCGFIGVFSSQILWEATFTGTVRLQVRGFAGQTGTYTLAYRGVDCGDNCPSPAGSLSPTSTCQTVSGTTNIPCQNNFYSVNLQANEQVRFTMCDEVCSGATADFDASLRVHAPACSSVAGSSDGGCNTSPLPDLSFTAAVAGPHNLEVTGTHNNFDAPYVGNYTLGYFSCGTVDTDGDTVHDDCDPDDDDDGLPDGADNCPKGPGPFPADPNQTDTDNDGEGDVCDPDDDDDGVDDGPDNCPKDANPGQEDLDNDGVGDICDDDFDGDGLDNDVDNCPLVFNPGQEDRDSNGIGDACELCLTAELFASDGQLEQFFGSAVDISGDLAVVGAWQANGKRGAVYVYRLGVDGWEEETILKASDGAFNDFFGFSVAADGDTVLVGSVHDDPNGLDSGSAYVFRHNAGVWTEEGQLIPAEGLAGDRFGARVALDADTAVIGAPRADTNGANSGAAWVFKRTGSSWAQEQRLLPNDGAVGDQFGAAVGVSGDEAVVGAWLDDTAGVNAGAVYHFRRSGSTWTQNAQIFADTPTPGDEFGTALSVSGTRVAIGSPKNDDVGTDAGAVYIYTLTGGIPIFEETLTGPTTGPGDLLGTSVSLSGVDLLVGAPGDSESGTNSGSAQQFRLLGTWIPSPKLLADDGVPGDRFGSSVAVEGLAAFIGAPGDNTLGRDAGSAYLFDDFDGDGDGVSEGCDNCPGVFNPDQADDDGDGIGNLCDECTDRDGDGHLSVPCGNDCDDDNPLVNPDQPEVCTTPDDDDCDGFLNCFDRDCQVDDDGDGQEDFPCGDDCDDSDPNNFLRNIEDCTDLQDNNCNDLIDCEDPQCLALACEDELECTSGSVCIGTSCIGTPTDALCDDGFACTVDICDTAGGCENVPDHGVCDDDLFCTGAEVCDPADGGAGADGCVDGQNPCADPRGCNEDLDQCESCQLDAFETDNTCGLAFPAAVGPGLGSQEHTLCPEEDIDHVRFDVVLGAQYTLYTTGELDTIGTLYRAGCVEEVAFNNDCSPDDQNFCIVWTATFTGRAVLKIWSDASGDLGTDTQKLHKPERDPSPQRAGGVGDYTLWFQQSQPSCEPDVFEPGDDQCPSANTILVLPATQWQDHTICGPGDKDNYRFLGEAGNIYRFWTSGGLDTKALIGNDLCQSLFKEAEDCEGDPEFCIEFIPTVTAFYTIRVEGQIPGTRGDYRLNYQLTRTGDCVEDPTEPDALCEQATPIEISEVEQTLSRSLCPDADQDHFVFFAEAGIVHRFQTSGTTDTRGLILDDPCVSTLLEAVECGDDLVNFCMDFQPATSGFYRLRVRGRNSGVRGDYVLHYQKILGCPEDSFEPDGTCGKATQLVMSTAEQRQSHTICPAGEFDLFEFFATAGTTYSFESSGPADIGGGVLSADCNRILLKDENCTGSGENFCLYWKAPETGVYKFGVTGEGDGGPYDLMYQEIADPGRNCLEDLVEPDSVCSQGIEIVPANEPQSTPRTVCPIDDRDHFTFRASRGVTYRFWTTGPTDTIGNLRDLTCTKLAGNDDCSLPDDLNFCLTWTAPIDASYHVRVRGFSRNQTVGPYTFWYEIVE